MKPGCWTRSLVSAKAAITMSAMKCVNSDAAVGLSITVGQKRQWTA